MALSIVPTFLQNIVDRTAVFRYLTTLRGEIETRLAAAETSIAASLPLAKKTATIAFGGLSAGNSNGAAVSVNIGTTLPANARIVGVALKLATPFTGGSASSVSLDIGTSGDDNAIVAGADVLAAAVDGQASTRPAGIAPDRHYASGGQLLAKFTPDAGHQLANLTAGSITIDVTYVVLA